MTSAPHNVRYSYDEYVALERFSNVKHEFLAGQIYAMSGGTPERAARAAAIIERVSPEVRKHGCRAYTSDLRLSTPSGLDTYPDVTIVCGPLAMTRATKSMPSRIPR